MSNKKNNQNVGFLIGEGQFRNLFFPMLYSGCHSGVGENDTELVDNLLLFPSSGFWWFFESRLKFQGVKSYIYILEETCHLWDF